MIDHYNAFISYRHVPRDITVAEEVQRQLERFRIPAAIRKSTGISKIERIFRDKDELPISANLTDDIDFALKHSDYLIVICSPAVLESVWVAREIDLFLETHSEQQVLTVLSEGDPAQAIPPRLLQRRETVTLEDGSRQEVMVPAEPLSCDYRMSFRNARKKELPRLAAVMLGCSYDELVNRTRQYQTRRIAALASVLFAAGAAALGWLLYSNARIRENLRQAYINQSRYLASESLKAYDDQDRILAAQLALAALPKEGEERPVIAEAEYALGMAVGAFTTPGTTSFQAVQRYDNGGVRIRDFMISPDRNHIAQIDNDYKLTMIDIGSGDVLAVKQLNTSVKLLEEQAGGVLIDMTNQTALLDWKTAEPVWENHLEHFTWNLTLAEDTDQYAVCSDDKVYVIDRSTGKEVWSAQVPASEGSFELRKAFLYADGKIGLIYQDTQSFLSSRQMLYMNEAPSSDVFVKVNHDFNDILHICENSAGNLVVTDRVAGENETSGFNTMWLLYESHMHFRGFDHNTGNVLWDILVPYTRYGYEDVRKQVYLGKDGNRHNGIVCTEANVQAVVDIDAGVLHKRTEWPSEVVDIYSTDEEQFSSLLSGGELTILYFNDDLSSCNKYFTGDIIRGRICSSRERDEAGIIILEENKNYLVKYLMNVYDSDYRELPDLQINSLQEGKIYGDRAVFLGSDEDNSKARVTVYDLTQEKTLYKYDIPDFSYYSLENMQISDDGSYAVILEDRYPHADAMVFGLQEEKFETFTLPKGAEESWSTRYYMRDGNIMYLSVRGDALMYGTWKYGEEIQEKSICSSELSPYALNLSPDGRKILVLGSSSAEGSYPEYLLDLETGEYRKTGTVQDSASWLTVWESDGKRFASLGEGNIGIYDSEGNEQTLLETDTEHLCDMAFIDGKLYSVYTDGRVIRWSETGETEKMYDTWIYTGTGRMKFEWISRGDTLYLGAKGMMNVLHTDQNQSSLYIPQTLAVDPEQRRVFIRCTKGSTGSVYGIGEFPLYTTEELIIKGQALVEGTSLSDQQKQTYGLE